jgi:hypothetical protein
LLGISYIPIVRKGIKDFARNHTGKVLTTMLPDALFVTDPKRIAHPELPSQITIAYGNKAAITKTVQQQGSTSMDVRLLHFEVDPTFLMNLFFFLSLVFITPIVWKRKLLSSTLGVVILYFVISLLLYLSAIENIANANIGIYQLSKSRLNFYATLKDVLNNANIFVIPLLVWGLTVFNKQNLSRFLDFTRN